MYTHRCSYIQAFLLTLLIVLLSACSDAANDSQPPPLDKPTVTLKSLEISPNNTNLAVNYQIKLHAIGIYSDNTKTDVSDKVLWTSLEPTKEGILIDDVEINSLGVIAAKGGTGVYTIQASLDNIISQSNITISNAALDTIVIESAVSSMVKGTTSKLTAIGHFSDGSKQNLSDFVVWTSTDSGVVKFTDNNPGTLLALEVGSSNATASLGSIKSTPLNLTVNSSTLISIDIESVNSKLGSGTQTQFIAIGIYADKSRQVITEDLVWISSNKKAVSISNIQGNKGIATALDAGESTINAEFNSVSSNSVKLTVTGSKLVDIKISTSGTQADPINLSLGTSIRFKASGIYRDRTIQDLSEKVIWASKDPTVAIVDNAHRNSGLVSPVDRGQTIITALYQGTSSNKVPLTVTNAKLISISVTPTNIQLGAGLTQQYQAIGTYADGSTANISKTVHWESTGLDFVTISNTSATAGLAKATNLGSTSILAHLSDQTSNTAVLEVTNAVLTSLSISPNNSTIVAGEQQQFTAFGFYSDNTKNNVTNLVTWQSKATQFVSVSNVIGRSGMASGLLQGSSTISKRQFSEFYSRCGTKRQSGYALIYRHISTIHDITSGCNPTV